MASLQAVGEEAVGGHAQSMQTVSHNIADHHVVITKARIT
jgi:hypothetical protein